jgi:hypothetical protein
VLRTFVEDEQSGAIRGIVTDVDMAFVLVLVRVRVLVLIVIMANVM